MMSLFSSFDLNINIFIFFSFIFMISSIMVISSNFNQFDFLLKKILTALNIFFMTLKTNGVTKFSILLMSSIFLFMTMVNLSSVLSYNFPVTSQMSSLMFFSLSIWIGFMSFYLVESSKNLISHLIPEGSPLLLVPLMFVIEMVSSMIRPLTVSVRMIANILAGHLLMILLSKLIMNFNLLLPLYVGLNLVELFVGLIQAYIYSTMLTLYYSEVT